MSDLLNAMMAAARAAGRGLLEGRARLDELRIDDKGRGDFVSQADLRAEETIRSVLMEFAPSYGFLGEEGGRRGGDSDLTWLVDPLDGTTNFLWGTPLFGINIALARGDDLLAGVIFLPVLGELLYAEKGGGAFMNGKPIHVSSRTRLAESVIAIGIPHLSKAGHERFRAEIGRLSPNTVGVRRTGAGSVDMAFVACGRFDAYFERVVTPWDLAAGAAIICEAGGVARGADGETLRLEGNSVCAGPAPLVEALIAESRLAGRSLQPDQGA
jgi:myo-inositol-1(or 4)-monophosphatase